jgi:two-component system, NtrC family, response regulator AtoC
LQSKLLTFLESWSYRPIGATREKTVDVLVVMATNRNLKQLVIDKQFREDLYFRINTMPIVIPSLRERKGDIALLLEHFIQFYSRREGIQGIVLNENVHKIFYDYQWPGNIRELKNLVERLTILYAGKIIEIQNLPVEMLSDIENTDKASSVEETMVDILLNNERELVLQALSECHWRKGIAAQKLGISRHALKRRIQKLGLE